MKDDPSYVFLLTTVPIFQNSSMAEVKLMAITVIKLYNEKHNTKIEFPFINEYIILIAHSIK